MVVFEPRVSPWQLARGRAKRLGYLTTAGQILFRLIAQPLLGRLGRARVEEICREHSLCRDAIPEPRRVPSVNSPECRSLLEELRPEVVVVNGTRIIGRQTLACVTCPIINMHAGITPLYRGVHGGYWALRQGQPEEVGTTIHLIDEGIDTGQALQRAYFRPGASDNFATLPYLHTAVGLPHLVRCVEAAQSGELDRLQCDRKAGPSRLWHHPTLWDYVKGLLAGVR